MAHTSGNVPMEEDSLSTSSSLDTSLVTPRSDTPLMICDDEARNWLKGDACSRWQQPCIHELYAEEFLVCDGCAQDTVTEAYVIIGKEQIRTWNPDGHMPDPRPGQIHTSVSDCRELHLAVHS